MISPSIDVTVMSNDYEIVGVFDPHHSYPTENSTGLLFLNSFIDPEITVAVGER